MTRRRYVLLGAGGLALGLVLGVMANLAGGALGGRAVRSRAIAAAATSTTDPARSSAGAAGPIATPADATSSSTTAEPTTTAAPTTASSSSSTSTSSAPAAVSAEGDTAAPSAGAGTARVSWYGAESGSHTANGDRYDPDGLTFAHKTMAFGTRVRFCGPAGCVVATCTDRGPFVAGRSFDLSRGAFAEVAGLAAGVATVSWAVAA